jgi:hypothetical protein
MPTLWAQTADYATISVGDDLPILVKFEFRPPVKDGADAPPEDPISTEKLTAYIKELLLKAFPPDNVNHEKTAIETEILSAFSPGDTISVCGTVAGKSDEGGIRAVECRVTVESQDGVLLANATASVSF